MFRFLKCPVTLLFFCLALTVGQANAQSPRVYVGLHGDDTNSGTPDAPFKTITKGVAAVDAGGDVVVIENGDYDTFVPVNKSVVITTAPGINASISNSSGYAIVVSGTQPTDTVTLRNFTVKSTANPAAGTGILNVSAAALNIDNCVFTGLDYAISMSANGQLFVHDTIVRNCNFGVFLNGPVAEGVAKALIEHSRFENDGYGIYIGSKTTAVVTDCTVSACTSSGIRVADTRAGTRATVTVEKCRLTHNVAGLSTYAANGGGASVRVSNSTITLNSSVGVSIFAGTNVFSLQNNFIEDNPSNVSGTLSPFTAK